MPFLYESQFQNGGELAAFLVPPGYTPYTSFDTLAEVSEPNWNNSVIHGAKDEDTTSTMEHFAAGGDGAELTDGLGSSVSAYTHAIPIWGKAKSYYADGEFAKAYHQLGKVAHLLADMTVPAHVHKDQHATNDDEYEQNWVADHFKQYNFNSVSPDWEIYMPSNLEDVFRLTTDYTDDYPSDDYWGDYPTEYPASFRAPNRHVLSGVPTSSSGASRPGELTPTQCADIADDLMPWAFEQTAALFRLFYSEVDTSPPERFAVEFDSPQVGTGTGGVPQFVNSVQFTASAYDRQSNVGVDWYNFGYQRMNPETGQWPGDGAESFQWVRPDRGPASETLELAPGVYRLMVLAVNGGEKWTFSAPLSPFEIVLDYDHGGTFFVDSGQSLGDADTRDLALGDLNGDGFPDAFVADNQGGCTVRLNDGAGQMIDSGQVLGAGINNAFAVELGDLDGDLDLDAVVVYGYGQPAKVWSNDGHGTFVDSGQSLAIPYGRNVALAHLNSDLFLDAFIVSSNAEPNQVWLNDGTGILSDSGQTLGSSDSTSVALADLEGDGDQDAVVANFNQPATVWRNDGNGNFTDTGQALGTSLSSSTGIALGNLNDDIYPDAFVTNYGRADRIWLNNGSGVFSDSGQAIDTPGSTGVALGDVDGDGDLDAMVVNASGNANTVWLNDGDGQMEDHGQRVGNADSRALALSDLDLDGDLDAMVGNYAGANRVWRNERGFLVTHSGEGYGSLSVAIAQANARPGVDTIVFSEFAGGSRMVYTYAPLPALTDPDGTVIDGITLPGYVTGAEADPVIIYGRGPGIGLSVDSESAGNELRGLEIAFFGEHGILNDGGLRIDRCVVARNSQASGDPGGSGILNNGQLAIDRSTLRDNSTPEHGGAIRNHGTLTVSNSLFRENEAGRGGGAIFDSGTLTIDNSTLVENSAYEGGAIDARGNATINHSTIWDNSALYVGGGIKTGYTNAIVNLDHTILSGNTAGSGGPNGYSVGDPVNSLGHNLVGDNSGAWFNADGTDLIGVDPRLDAGPANNGGPTLTVALLGDSPAIDAGDPTITSTALTDQRGMLRVIDGNDDDAARVDIGAFEFGSRLPSSVVGRHVFHNNSVYDGDDPLPGASDDSAIVPGKTALLPGRPAMPIHCTAYHRGINGIMVNIAGLGDPADLSTADFLFKVGDPNDPTSWTPAPAPDSITVRVGEGVDGSDRVTILWPDGAIKNEWLRVTVQSTAKTCLTEPDIFCFGHTSSTWQGGDDAWRASNWAEGRVAGLPPRPYAEMVINVADSIVRVEQDFVSGVTGPAGSVAVGESRRAELRVDATLQTHEGVLIGPNGTLSGTGTVQVGGQVQVEGVLEPGRGIGTLAVQGNVVMDGGSTMAVELSGNGAPVAGINSDLLTAGDLILTGSPTLELEWLAGEVGNGLFGGIYTIATYSGSLTGTFANPALTAAYNGADASVYIDTAYGTGGIDYGSGTNDAITVKLKDLLPGDANLDGDVDVWQFNGSGDAQILSSNLGTATGATWSDGDFNFDGDVDVWQFDGGGDAQLLSSNLGASHDIVLKQADAEEQNPVDGLFWAAHWECEHENASSRNSTRKAAEAAVDLLLATDWK